MNLKYMKVSLFEITYKKKWKSSRHSNLLRCTCTSRMDWGWEHFNFFWIIYSFNEDSYPILTHKGAEGHHSQQALQEDAKGVHEVPVWAAPGIRISGRGVGGCRRQLIPRQHAHLNTRHCTTLGGSSVFLKSQTISVSRGGGRNDRQEDDTAMVHNEGSPMSLKSRLLKRRCIVFHTGPRCVAIQLWAN